MNPILAKSRTRGFSLVELAIGMVIVAVLLSSLLVPLVTQVDQRRAAETQRLLSDARDALITFAATNRRLPCPAGAASNGAEQFAAGGSAANGRCAFQSGFLPAATLGLSPVDPQGYQSDPYGEQQAGNANTNRIRYAVRSSGDGSFSLAGVENPFTRTGGISGQVPLPANTVSLQTVAGTNTYLTICAFARANVTDTTCTGVKALVANFAMANGNAIAVLFSLGANGPSGAGAFGPDELENTDGHLMVDPGPPVPDRFFVSRTQGNVTGDVYDDQILWIAPAALLTRMLTAGTLP